MTARRIDPTTGLTRETVRRYSGERELQQFDPFGRITQTRFGPADSRTEIVLGEVRYFDAEDTPLGQPFVETRTRLSAQSDEFLRSASYLDALGREVRSVAEAPRTAGGERRFFGTASQLNPGERTGVVTFPAPCGGDGTDASWVGLLEGRQPSSAEERDALGRPVRVTTPDGVTQFAYRSVERTHPDSGAGRFDAVLKLDARGALTQRVLDRGRVLWVEECSNEPRAPRGGELDRRKGRTSGLLAYRVRYGVFR